MKKFLPITLAILFSTSICNSSLAFQGDGPPPPNDMNRKPGHHMTKEQHEKRKQEFIKRLNLNEEQQKQMKTLHQELRAKAKPIFENKKALRDEIQEARQQKLSKKELRPLFEELEDLQEELRVLKEEHDKKVKSILTPEQQKIFQDIKEEHKKKREEMRKKRREERKNLRNEKRQSRPQY